MDNNKKPSQVIRMDENHFVRFLSEAAIKVASIMSQQAGRTPVQLNEGPGAGYEVVVEGINLDASTAKIEKVDSRGIYWAANILPGLVDKWSAQGYYNGITSDGVPHDGWVDEFDEEERRIEGGEVWGYITLEELNNETDSYFEDTDQVDEASIQKLVSQLSPITVKEMYGCGYIHCNLDEKEIALGNDGDTLDEYGFISKAFLVMPYMAQNVNWYFAHCNDEDFDNPEGDYVD